MVKRIIAYEDDPALRKQLECVFNAIREEYELVATFPNPNGIMAEINICKPDAVLMDLQMLKEDDGLVALYRIKQTRPDLKVLVLTMFDADQKVFNALCLGADGYMLKSDFLSYQVPHEVLRKSLNMIFVGDAYLTPSVAKQIMKLFTDLTFAEKVKKVTDRFQSIFQKETSGSRFKESGLTRMQKVVLQKIIDGKTTAQMAKEMELSENTVNSHIKAIYKILEVHSRALAIKKAIEQKWLS
jgi:DNA-binding NarL/FixJ family response regulator